MWKNLLAYLAGADLPDPLQPLNDELLALRERVAKLEIEVADLRALRPRGQVNGGGVL